MYIRRGEVEVTKRQKTGKEKIVTKEAILFFFVSNKIANCN